MGLQVMESSEVESLEEFSDKDHEDLAKTEKLFQDIYLFYFGNKGWRLLYTKDITQLKLYAIVWQKIILK